MIQVQHDGIQYTFSIDGLIRRDTVLYLGYCAIGISHKFPGETIDRGTICYAAAPAASRAYITLIAIFLSDFPSPSHPTPPLPTVINVRTTE